MDLPVDRARQDQAAGEVLDRLGAWRRTAAEARYRPAAYRNIAALDNAVRKHDVAFQDKIEIRHGANIYQPPGRGK